MAPDQKRPLKNANTRPAPERAPGGGREWYPIETAPRDGTPILAYRAGHYGKFGHMQVTYWRRPEDKKGYTGWGEFNKDYWPPTHWMPLPEPPE